MANKQVLAEKQAKVDALTEKIKGSVAGVLVDYKGITVADDTKLRKELREAGVHYFVVKNTILERAADNVGFGELKNCLSGTTALAVSEKDQVAAAKIISKFADSQKDKFTIKAGYVDGAVIPTAEVIALGKLPNREGLLSMLLSALTGNLRGLACAIDAVAKKQGGEAQAE